MTVISDAFKPMCFTLFWANESWSPIWLYCMAESEWVFAYLLKWELRKSFKTTVGKKAKKKKKRKCGEIAGIRYMSSFLLSSKYFTFVF